MKRTASREPIPVRRLIEKPSEAEAPSNLAVLGRYVLPPSIFDALEETPLGHGGELQLTDALQRLAALNLVDAYQFEGVRHDIGNLEGWLKANLAFGLEDPKLAVSMRNWLADDRVQSRLASF
ncbi:hypothetical protein GCM10025858_07370 [Alicyclobacillus sacchari]|nr:hypothetical protein GCM10025858_07370 [Alicyclobacillus sacchari]